MIAVTGASGQLGQLVIRHLLKTVPPSRIVAAVRNPDKATNLAALGIEVRYANYDAPDQLPKAFAGVEKLLLISSSEIGRRVPQHRAVIDAAQSTGVKLLAYTSILHADRSKILLANEHRQTETILQNSGIPHVLLRNGWYTENYTATIPIALENGGIAGCAGDGRLASAARTDYAAAAAAVLINENQAGKTYELAGDHAYTLTDLAAEISRQTGKEIGYRNMPEDEYRQLLISIGLPEGFAAALADAETGLLRRELFDDSHQLSELIGRPTTPLSQSVEKALKN